jgi:hypothetical protein
MHCSRVVEPTFSQLNLVLPFGVCYLELKGFLLFLLLMRDKIMKNSFHEQRGEVIGVDTICRHNRVTGEN